MLKNSVLTRLHLIAQLIVGPNVLVFPFSLDLESVRRTPEFLLHRLFSHHLSLSSGSLTSYGPSDNTIRLRVALRPRYFSVRCAGAANKISSIPEWVRVLYSSPFFPKKHLFAYSLATGSTIRVSLCPPGLHLASAGVTAGQTSLRVATFLSALTDTASYSTSQRFFASRTSASLLPRSTSYIPSPLLLLSILVPASCSSHPRSPPPFCSSPALLQAASKPPPPRPKRVHRLRYDYLNATITALSRTPHEPESKSSSNHGPAARQGHGPAWLRIHSQQPDERGGKRYRAAPARPGGKV